MLAMKPIIVFIMLFILSLCEDPPTTTSEPDLGSPEEFLREVNEYRAKFAKEDNIPNMYKLIWSNEFVKEVKNDYQDSDGTRFRYGGRMFYINSYQNVTESLNNEMKEFKKQRDAYMKTFRFNDPMQLINKLQEFIGCVPQFSFGSWSLICSMGFSGQLSFGDADPGEAGSQCSPRFKGENGLCVPVDPSKHTFWGTEEGLFEDVNYMRRKYAKKFGIPNMHQLTWNESLVGVLKSLDWSGDVLTHQGSSDSGWDGLETRWRITELFTFSAAATAIDEAVHDELVLNQSPSKTSISGIHMLISASELIHPLQTSIGCMKVKQTPPGIKSISTVCLIGNKPSKWEFDVNSKKEPGSECMDGYINDDGLCVSAPPTTSAPKPVPNVPKKPEVSGAPVKEAAAMESEQEEEAESSSTTNLSYGLWIIYLLLSFF